VCFCAWQSPMLGGWGIPKLRGLGQGDRQSLTLHFGNAPVLSTINHCKAQGKGYHER
jgi:hypothetical protein